MLLMRWQRGLERDPELGEGNYAAELVTHGATVVAPLCKTPPMWWWPRMVPGG